MPAAAIFSSTSGPSEAPVKTSIWKRSFLARSTSASGTIFASPARVKPLIPTSDPSLIHDAASSAETTLSCNVA